MSCASCHNGRSKPVRTPPLAIEMTPEQAAAAAAARERGGRGGPGGPAGAGPAGAPGGPGGQGRGAEPPPPPVPTETVDQIVAKYVQALGGQQALQNAKTRVMTGTVTTRDLVSSNVTVQEKATESTASILRPSRSRRFARPTARPHGRLAAVAVAVAALVHPLTRLAT